MQQYLTTTQRKQQKILNSEWKQTIQIQELSEQLNTGINASCKPKQSFSWTIDNEYYVTGMGNAFTVLIETYNVTSLNLKLCVLNVNEFFLAEQLEKRALQQL